MFSRMSLRVRPFEAADLSAAGALLAERHRRHRAAQPLLSPRYEDPSTATAQVSAAWDQADASGAVAERDGEVVGYLLGAPKGDLWGPNIWIEQAGQAVTDAEDMRDIYAAAAARWVDEGRTAHYALTPATEDDLVRAWYRLGFGQQQAHGVRDGSPSSGLSTVEVRRAVRDDIPMLGQLDLELTVHQRRAPTFSSVRLGTLEENIEEWEKDFDDPAYTTFVVERDGEVVGSAVGCSLEQSSSHAGLARPENAGFLGFAAVLPRARGLGIGRALGEAVIDWSAQTGYDCVVTDWRVTNLLSSRAWPALGFTESFLRLHRSVGF
jgi:GNAT superfamily N-acetyltransferase